MKSKIKTMKTTKRMNIYIGDNAARALGGGSGTCWRPSSADSISGLVK